LGHSLTGTTPGEKSSKKSIVPAKISMELRQKIGFIFQNHNLLKALSSQDNVGLPLERDGLTGIERNQKAQIILKRLGLGNHLNAYPAQLSGGQRQRVAIARALVRKPALVLADEPTASLDFTSALEVMACLKEAASSWGTTTIMVTHDQRLMHHVDRVIHMEDGTIITQNNQAAVA
jgi:putative ABC transport system ATP-binding protein